MKFNLNYKKNYFIFPGQLNDTQIAEYEEAFLEFADEDGKITTQNLKTIMQGLVETMTEPANLEDMMEAAAFPG